MDETTNPPVENGDGEEKNNTWAWVVTGLVVAAIAAAFYVWPQGSGEEAAAPENTENVAAEPTDEYTASLQNVGVSNEVADIENELKNTNLDDLDRELSDVESEINAQ